MRLPDPEDAAGIAGAVALSAGAAFVYPPAGLIVLGLLLLAAAVAGLFAPDQPEDDG